MLTINSKVRLSYLDLTSRFFKYLLLSGAILYLVFYLTVVYFRIQYPFELEWMEGGMVDHVRRILNGQQLYVNPSLDFIPYLYPPLYFYLSALLSSIIGEGFLPLRLLSFIASLGCFLIIFLFVQRETGSKYSAAIASCLFAATFRLSGAWFDISRIDSLFLFFLLASLYFIRFGESTKAYIFAGVLISLSFLSKQTALIIFLPIMFYCILVNRRQAVFFTGTTILIIGASTVFLNYIHDGWYIYYIFDLPRQHPIVKEMIVGFWTEFMLPLKIALIMSVFYLLSEMFNADKRKFLFYSFFFVGMVGASWAGVLHSGGFPNVLMPAYSVVAILFGMAFYTYLEFTKNISENNRNLLGIFICLLCLLQFGSGALRYSPDRFIPMKNDVDAGKKFINKLAQIEGEVFIPDHGYLPALAGKKSHAQGVAIRDLMKGKGGTAKAIFIEEFKRAIQEKRFSAIFIDSHMESMDWFPMDIEKYYVKKQRIFENNDVFIPVTGMKTRPEFIYVPERNDGIY